MNGLFGGFATLFEFSLDLRAEVDPASSRTFESIELSTPANGGFSTSGDAFVEINTEDLLGPGRTFLLDIGTPNPTVLSASANLDSVSGLSLFNFIEGESGDSGSFATLDQFSLKLTLAGDPPPPIPDIPLPGSLPLFAGALAFGACVLRRRRPA